METLCVIEKIVVDIERTGAPKVCRGGAGACSIANTLIPAIPAKPSAKTTYCPVVE